MLYELLSQRQVTTIIQCLQRLVDELTPLLKHEMERLPPQQRQIVHALMERGGTAKPVELVGPTRLPLNAITSQLKRLKESQVLEVLGGGKGRPASYTVPDKLFAIWYQMRYLNQNRRRIELFVEALRVWFEAQERFSILRALDELGPGASAPALREAAATAEYFAASLAGTGYETTAKDLAVRQWLRTGDHREAALALAGLAEITLAEGVSREASAYSTLGQWCLQHREPRAALVVLGRIIAARNTQPALLAEALVERGICKGALGDHEGALTDFSAVVVLDEVPRELVAMALFNRGVAKGMLGDAQGEIADYTAVVT
jgi:hypothetical protein